MNTYKIIVEYDGTNYFGWQIQPNKITITGVLEERFHSIFGERIAIAGASRTDAGVHALGQTAQFSSNLDIDKDKLIEIYNNSLPRDIVIRKIKKVGEDFHVRKNVSMKTYYYHIFKERPNIFFARYGYYYPKLNIDELRDKLQIFIGTHDFRSFCTGYEKECTIRTIESIEIRYIKQWKAYRIEFKGKGFLRHMIRRVIGGALDKKFSKEHLLDILYKKNNNQRIVTAPAHGLLLYKINY